MIKTISRKELNAVPIPQETKSYKPISTRLILDTIDDLSRAFDMGIKAEQFETRMGGHQQKMRFLFETNSNRFGFEIGVINSYNKTISLRSAGGSSLLLCWNLMCSSDFKIQEKHIGEVQEDLVHFLKDCFTAKTDQLKNAEVLYEGFNQVYMTKDEMMQLAGQMFFEEDLLNTEQASILKQQLKKSSFNYDVPKNSLNELYQHTTFALQNEHPAHYFQTQKATQSFFVDYHNQKSFTKLELV